MQNAEEKLDMDINLRVNSPISYERLGFFEMFSEMIIIFLIVLVVIPLTVILVTKKVK